MQLKHELKIFPERRAVEKVTSDERHQICYQSIFSSLKTQISFLTEMYKCAIEISLIKLFAWSFISPRALFWSLSLKVGYNHGLKSSFPSSVVYGGRFDSKLLLKEF